MFKFLFGHKISSLITIVALVVGGYFYYEALKSDTSTVSYNLAKAEKGTIITSVSGSGQISAENQVDIKSGVAGNVLSVSIKNGQEVKADSVIAQVDSRDAYMNVLEAETSLKSAKLALEKLYQPVSENSIVQAENSLNNAKNTFEKLKITQQTEMEKARKTKSDAEAALADSYEDAYNAITGVFLDLPDIISGLNSALFGEDISPSTGQTNDVVLLNNVLATDWDDYSELSRYIESSRKDYDSAKKAYDENYADFQKASYDSEGAAMEVLLQQTIDTVRIVSSTVKNESASFDKWVDYRTNKQWPVFAKVAQYQTTLSGYTTKTGSELTTLLNAQKAIQTKKDALAEAERVIKEKERNNPIDLATAEATVKEKETSLAELKEGPDAFDIENQQLTIKQRENALADAREKLADYTIRAPFDGVIVATDIKKGDTLSVNGAIATLITKQRIAEVSLNEVDAAKVKQSQKVTLSMDAIEGLNITGEVAEVDALGTVSQGVVTYNVKIIFDIQDERVKPGMSVSASIITEVKQDVLLVANAAVKTLSSGEGNYIEAPNEEEAVANAKSLSGVYLKNQPIKKTVKVGLSNDSSTEIIEGLKEGDLVIIKTVDSSVSTAGTNSSTQNNRSIFQMGSGPR